MDLKEWTMAEVSVADALAGKPGENQAVTIKGWVRTRRDSKGGFSFITVNDGSCFDSIQVVAPGTLSNYASDVPRIPAGCSVIITGKLVKSQGKGQAFEIRADEMNVLGWV